MSYYRNFRTVFDNPLWSLYLRWAYRTCIADLRQLGVQPDFGREGFACLLCGVAQERTADEFIRFTRARNSRATIWIIDRGDEQVEAVERLVSEKYADADIRVHRADALDLRNVIPRASLDWIETDGFLQYFDGPSLHNLFGVWNNLLRPDGFITLRDFATAGPTVTWMDTFRTRLVRRWLGCGAFRHSQEELDAIFSEYSFTATTGRTPLYTYKRFAAVRRDRDAADVAGQVPSNGTRI